MSAATLRLAFVRGTSPNKWATRWQQFEAHAPLVLIALDVNRVPDATTLEPHDVLLERVDSGVSAATSDRHAVRLYVEDVALVISKDHELAGESLIEADELSLVQLIHHPDHSPEWPAAAPWPAATLSPPPRDVQQALDLVAAGDSGALLPLPLARQLTNGREHAVVRVAEGETAPGTEIWASWAVERDDDEVQALIGVMRGRTPRSSRQEPARRKKRRG